MAVISKSREIDCSKIISNHELIITSRCLKDRTQSLYSGHRQKSKILPVLKKSAGITFLISLSEIVCVATDGSDMLHLLQKAEQIKTGADLVITVCLSVDNKTKFCSTIIINFDTTRKCL